MDKTEIMRFSSNKKTKIQIRINNWAIQATGNICSLGRVINRNLTVKKHYDATADSNAYK